MQIGAKTKSTLAWGSAALVLACSVSAETLKPAPQYYIDTVVAITGAEALTKACSEFSLDGDALRNTTSELLSRLKSEGYDTSRADGGMEAASHAVNARMQEILSGHGLVNGSSEEDVCAAARSELANDGPLAPYLLEVTG